MKSQVFAVKGAFAATPAARAIVMAEVAAQPVFAVPVAPATLTPAAAAPMRAIDIAAPRRPMRPRDIFIDPGLRFYPGRLIPRPDPPLRRSELKVPAAPTATPSDTDVFESADGSVKHVLPRYVLAFDKVGSVEEPRIAIADRNGTPTLVITLNETPSAAAAPGATELPHAISVTLKYRVPVISGGQIVQELSFPSVLLDATETVVTAELPLTPGQRAQILAALSSLDASATLVVGRGVTVGVPTGEALPDGAPGYRQRNLLLNWTVPPEPIVLSVAQRDRLGGGGGSVQPLIRQRIAFEARNRSYWQDPARPDHFYFLPDRFLLARVPDGDQRPPLLRARAVAMVGDESLRMSLEFQARPIVDSERLQAAHSELVAAARQRGGTGALDLEIMPDPQPLLRLALPENGAPGTALTERPGVEIDLEAGLVHSETMRLEDFRLVYEALFGGSLTLLRGEVRAAMSGGDPEDIPLELRIDKTVGDILSLAPGSATPDGLVYRLTNAIESPVRIDRLAVTATIEGKNVPLRIDRLAPGQRLAPGESVEVLLAASDSNPLPGPEAILIDQSGVTVEPNADAIWTSVLNKRADPQIERTVTIEATPAFFSSSPERPNDPVAAFVVTLERGGTVRLTENELKATTTARVPLEPLIVTTIPVPPIRYRTETWWSSGGRGDSDWREAPGNILYPVKAPPA